jgi:hypothetical protein
MRVERMHTGTIMSKSKKLSAREAERRRVQRLGAILEQPGTIRVYPWAVWCDLCGFSEDTGDREAAAGRVQVTYMSDRRKGVRSDHHMQYLEACSKRGKASA